MRRIMTLVLLVLPILLSTTGAVLAKVAVVFKHDQFSDSIAAAGEQVSGVPLGTQAGFVYGEAFGALFKPSANAYPVVFTALDLIVGGPPFGGTGVAHADIEFYFHDSDGPDPGKKVPDFVLSTTDVFDPISGQEGMPLTGSTGMQFEFDQDDPQGHPPVLNSGNFTVAIRFRAEAANLGAEWGDPMCDASDLLGTCGCQQVGAMSDPATTTGANVMHLVSPLGTCSGDVHQWYFAESLNVSGDFILRVRATVNEGTCNASCDGKECGSDGCGGDCGDCSAGMVCKAGECVESTCTPACDGKNCGDDGCGDTCGQCADGESCVQGECQGVGCTTECDGKECGDDGCGGACGLCAEGISCVEGVCEDSNVSSGALQVTAISPVEGFNDEDTEVSIVGEGFVPGATVKLGATHLSAVTIVSAGLISARVPAGMTAGTYLLIVVNSDGDTATLDAAFEVLEPPSGPSSGCTAGPTARGPLLPLMLLAGLLLVWRRRHC